jgi:hypothetical protein
MAALGSAAVPYSPANRFAISATRLPWKRADAFSTSPGGTVPFDDTCGAPYGFP